MNILYKFKHIFYKNKKSENCNLCYKTIYKKYNKYDCYICNNKFNICDNCKFNNNKLNKNIKLYNINTKNICDYCIYDNDYNCSNEQFINKCDQCYKNYIVCDKYNIYNCTICKNNIDVNKCVNCFIKYISFDEKIQPFLKIICYDCYNIYKKCNKCKKNINVCFNCFTTSLMPKDCYKCKISTFL